MKKMLMMLTVFSVLCGEASAQQVRVPDMEALPGETVSLTLQINTEGGSYTGLEFDILFPADGFTTTNKGVNTTGSWDGAFTIGDVGGVEIDNLARCALMSYTDTPIPGEGLQTIGTVEFTVDAAMPLGEYVVTMTNMTLIGDGRTPVEETTFKLNVVEVYTMTLDETSTTAPVASEGAVNVLVKRTIKAGEWSTICLPFAMTEDQVKEAFGEDVLLADFDGCDTEEDGDDNTVGITVKFNEATAIEANHPYIIKVTEPLTQFTANGVTIEPEDEAVVTSVALRTGSGTKKDPYVYFYDYFTGSYVANTEVPTMALFLSGGKFYYSAGKNRMKAFRAYFELYFNLTDVEETYAGENVKMAFNKDGGTTRIGEMVNGKWSNGQCFDLSGRAITRPHTKGVYVIDGRKVVR